MNVHQTIPARIAPPSPSAASIPLHIAGGTARPNAGHVKS